MLIIGYRLLARRGAIVAHRGTVGLVDSLVAFVVTPSASMGPLMPGQLRTSIVIVAQPVQFLMIVDYVVVIAPWCVGPTDSCSDNTIVVAITSSTRIFDDIVILVSPVRPKAYIVVVRIMPYLVIYTTADYDGAVFKFEAVPHYGALRFAGYTIIVLVQTTCFAKLAKVLGQSGLCFCLYGLRAAWQEVHTRQRVTRPDTRCRIRWGLLLRQSCRCKHQHGCHRQHSQVP